MLSAFFKQSPLLDENTSLWIKDTFAWAMAEFDGSYFLEHSQLILPTNEFYPGSVSSIKEMAQAVFDKTKNYAGLQNWPIRLVQPELYQPKPLPEICFKDQFRGDKAELINDDFREGTIKEIIVSYNPQQINQPQDLVASFAQSFAAILIAQRRVTPPGGQELLPQAMDLLACFMGFGVMFANTAYQFKGGCGSCYNKNANREVALPETEMIYALALFSIHKKIPAKKITFHLKSHLRNNFKKAYKELRKN